MIQKSNLPNTNSTWTIFFIQEIFIVEIVAVFSCSFFNISIFTARNVLTKFTSISSLKTVFFFRFSLSIYYSMNVSNVWSIWSLLFVKSSFCKLNYYTKLHLILFTHWIILSSFIQFVCLHILKSFPYLYWKWKYVNENRFGCLTYWIVWIIFNYAKDLNFLLCIWILFPLAVVERTTSTIEKLSSTDFGNRKM